MNKKVFLVKFETIDSFIIAALKIMSIFAAVLRTAAVA